MAASKIRPSSAPSRPASKRPYLVSNASKSGAFSKLGPDLRTGTCLVPVHFTLNDGAGALAWAGDSLSEA